MLFVMSLLYEPFFSFRAPPPLSGELTESPLPRERNPPLFALYPARPRDFFRIDFSFLSRKL